MRTLVLSVVLVLSGCSEHTIRNLPKEKEKNDTVPTRPTNPTNPTDPTEPTQPDPNEPVADAGPDAEFAPLETVALDGMNSYDPQDNAIVEFAWTVVSQPDGSTASLDNDTSPRPEFFADLAGDYTFALTVQNDKGVWDSSPDEVTITVTPLEGFYVELSWDTGADLDLHLLDGSTGLFGAGDCNYCNMNPDWGAAGGADDPSLDWDSITGFGPETITIDAPAAGSYDVRVHYFSPGGCYGPCGTTNATVRVYLDGVLHEEFVSEVEADANVWIVGEIDWPSGQVTSIDQMSSTNDSFCW